MAIGKEMKQGLKEHNRLISSNTSSRPATWLAGFDTPGNTPGSNEEPGVAWMRLRCRCRQKIDERVELVALLQAENGGRMLISCSCSLC
ncbi:hypothetical protein C5167_008237 [Papaver somniferum]|uniref:Uncharacterized protein n=1 Tax=Papaver somniferum TaxID=3469 RepID=A0A4Y7JXU0_PAPSO|nr:hypothetical protein C5167_008237 [Papaver somniferum]